MARRQAKIFLLICNCLFVFFVFFFTHPVLFFLKLPTQKQYVSYWIDCFYLHLFLLNQQAFFCWHSLNNIACNKKWRNTKNTSIKRIVKIINFMLHQIIYPGKNVDMQCIHESFTREIYICVCSSNATNNLTSKKQNVCSLSAIGTWKPEEEKDARGVTYFMEENVISPREVARFNEHIRN